MKLTNWIFSTLIIAALVWTGCSKSESHAPTQTKNSTIAHMSGGVAPINSNNPVIVHDSNPVLPDPNYYLGHTYIAGYCMNNFINTSQEDFIRMYWKTQDSVVFELDTKLSNNYSYSWTLESFVYHVGPHILDSQHEPIRIASSRYNNVSFTLFNDSLHMYRLVSCGCPDYVTQTFSGVKQ
jgi:hypothetical protein